MVIAEAPLLAALLLLRVLVLGLGLLPALLLQRTVASLELATRAQPAASVLLPWPLPDTWGMADALACAAALAGALAARAFAENHYNNAITWLGLRVRGVAAAWLLQAVAGHGTLQASATAAALPVAAVQQRVLWDSMLLEWGARELHSLWALPAAAAGAGALLVKFVGPWPAMAAVGAILLCSAAASGLACCTVRLRRVKREMADSRATASSVLWQHAYAHAALFTSQQLLDQVMQLRAVEERALRGMAWLQSGAQALGDVLPLAASSACTVTYFLLEPLPSVQNLAAALATLTAIRGMIAIFPGVLQAHARAWAGADRLGPVMCSAGCTAPEPALNGPVDVHTPLLSAPPSHARTELAGHEIAWPADDIARLPGSAAAALRATADSVAELTPQPWIFRGSLVDNLLPASALESARWASIAAGEECSAPAGQPELRALAQACLGPDIVRWTSGCRRELQEAGQNLSGGQRVRLAVARWILHPPRIMLIHQSALDSLEPGARTAVLRGLCTGLAGRCQLAIVDPDDTSAQYCTRELVAGTGDTWRWQHCKTAAAAAAAVARAPDGESEAKEHQMEQAFSSVVQQSPAAQATSADAQPSGSASHSASSSGWIWRAYLAACWPMPSPASRWWYSAAVCCALCAAWQGAVALATWLALGSMPSSSAQLGAWGKLYASVTGAGVVLGAATACVVLLSTVHAASVQARQFLAAVAATHPAWAGRTPAAELDGHSVGDISAADEQLPATLLGAVVQVAQLLGGLAVTCAAVWPVTPGAVGALLVFGRVLRLFRPVARDSQRWEAAARTPLSFLCAALKTGRQDLAARGALPAVLRASDTHVLRWLAAAYTRKLADRWLSLRMDVLVAVFVGLVGVAGAAAVKAALLPPAAVALGLAFATSLVNTLGWTLRAVVFAESGFVCVERLARCTSQAQAHRMPAPSPSTATRVSLAQQGGVLQARSASWRWGECEPWVFQHVAWRLRAGKILVITGPSGQGKSSWAAYMAGLAASPDLVTGEITAGAGQQVSVPHARSFAVRLIPQHIPELHAAASLQPAASCDSDTWDQHTLGPYAYCAWTAPCMARLRAIQAALHQGAVALLVDEPSAGVPTDAGAAAWARVLHHVARQGVAVAVITHDVRLMHACTDDELLFPLTAVVL